MCYGVWILQPFEVKHSPFQKVKDAENLPTLLIGENQLLGNFFSYYGNRYIDVKQTPGEAQFPKVHTMKEAN